MVWSGYPLTAAAMRSAVGYGTWTSAYLCNETSGNLVPVFGSPNLSANGTPTYGQDGALGDGVDKSIKFDSAADFFDSVSTTNDVTAAEDLAFAWVWKLTTLTGGQAVRLTCKTDFLGGPGFNVSADSTQVFIIVDSGAPDLGLGAGPNIFNEWVAGMVVLERATNKLRIGIKGLQSGRTYIATEADASSIGSLSNAQGFVVGSLADQPWWLSGLYIAKGIGACTGMSANLPTALANFANTVSKWAGYPTTATAMQKAVGYGTWSAGWSFDITSGNDPGLFGGITMTGLNSPSYSNPGPRTDLAVGFAGGSIAAFSANNNFDVGNGDLILAGVAKVDADLVNGDVVWLASKIGASGYVVHLFRNDAISAGLAFFLSDGVDGIYTNAYFPSGRIPVGQWFVWMVVLERATNRARTAVKTLGANPYPLQWTLTKTATNDDNDSGGYSVETITGDGFIECTPSATNKLRSIGLSVDTTISITNVDYALQLDELPSLSVYENNTLKGTFGAFAAGDVLRVERSGTTVTYKKNGTVIYTSTIASTGPLHVVGTMFRSGSVLDNVRMAQDGVYIPVSWVLNKATTPGGFISDSITEGESNVTAIGTVSTSSHFVLGAAGEQDKTWQCAAMYVGTGLGVGSGMSANLDLAISNFASAIDADTKGPTVTVVSTPTENTDPIVLQISDYNKLNFLQISLQDSSDGLSQLVYEPSEGFYYPFNGKSTVTGQGTWYDPYILTVYRRGRWPTGISAAFRCKAIDTSGNITASTTTVLL